ncbi:MAG: aspartate--tRNA ligase [Clostridia bacterium]|nr:aspartate--tRNA ligase [Clostridia bacterium]
MDMYRTNTCGELRVSDENKTVKLAGWLDTVRDLGAVIFFTLRDFYGVTQVVVSEEEMKASLRKISRESTISVTGKVVKRSDPNPNLPTGEIEIIPEEIEVLGRCTELLPFEINNSLESREDIRLKYRFLDLRNPVNKDKLILRSKVIRFLRNAMCEKGFFEIQTPILTSSSPEGARDYLVPSRVHPGKFYALPQAPQQFKQLLMVSGIDRYFQIAPCFRDEDARADRSPGEFYQLDMEMAFATQEDVFAVMEDVLSKTFREFSNFEIAQVPFPRIKYVDAMEKYGSDKPDLRNPLIIHDVTSIFAKTEIGFFKDKVIKAIGLNDFHQPRSFFDNLNTFITQNEGKGVSWTKIGEDGEFSGGITKYLSDEEKAALIAEFDLKANSAVLFIADEKGKAQKLAGLLRNEAGSKLDLIEKNVYKFCWIVDFPMFELDEETGEICFSHNPFSMPQGGMEALKTMNPLDIVAYQYDIVCNGIELSSGAVRNHDSEIMVKAFEIAGYPPEVVETKFPALFNAFKYGAPPHAGIAPGVDRMVMMLANEPNIREVIAFPMNKNAQDLLMGAPGEVTQKQLDELRICVKKEEKK